MKNFWLLIITYIFAFSPIIPAFGIGTIKFLYILLPFLFVPTVINNLKATKSIFAAFSLFYIYVIIRSINADADAIQILYNATIVFIEDFFISHIIIYMHIKHSGNLVKSLMGCLYIAVFSALLCLLSPSIKTFVDNYVSMPNLINGVVPDNRGFGIGLEKTFSYSVSTAIIFVYLLFSKKNVKKLFLLLPFVAISIMINARTGLIILLLGILLYLINVKLLLKPKTILFFLVLGFFFTRMNFTFLSNSSVGEFVLDFFEQINVVVSGESNYGEGNTVILLLNAFDYYLPQNILEWLIGPGHVVGHETMVVLDNGYFHELYFGGIVYIALCFLIPLVFYQKTFSNYKFFSLFLLLSCFILNFKAPFVPMAHGFKLISLLSIYMSLHSYYMNQTTLIDGKK